MMATREICALLLAGSMGAGSVVTVQQVAPKKPAVTKARKAPVRRTAPKRTAPPAAPRILDCPTPGLGGDIWDAPVWQTSPFNQGRESGTGWRALSPVQNLVPDGGGGSHAAPPSPITPPITPDGGPDAVPEPSAWALMITGFGAIGLTARKGAARRERNPA